MQCISCQRLNYTLIKTPPKLALCTISAVALSALLIAGACTSTHWLTGTSAALLVGGIAGVALWPKVQKIHRQMIDYTSMEVISPQMPKMTHHWFGYKSATGEHPLFAGIRQTYLALFHHPTSFKHYTPSAQSLQEITYKGPPHEEDSPIKARFGGHASFEFTIANDFRIWFDPVDGNIPFMCNRALYPQMTPLALEGRPDLCCITHDHSDHCDVPRLEELQNQGTTLLVPEDADSLFKYDNVHSLKWGEGISHTHGDYSIDVIHVPAFHSSQRGLFDCQQRGFGGYILQVREGETLKKTIYNAGDTAYNQQLFDYILDEYHPDAILCSISPTENEEEFHATTAQWHQAIRYLGSEAKKITVIPQHYGKFAYEYTQDANEQLLYPLKKFQENFPDDVANLMIFKIGEEKAL